LNKLGLQRLKKSICEVGWMAEKTPYVRETTKRNGEKGYQVVEGNHRVTALKELCEELPQSSSQWVFIQIFQIFNSSNILIFFQQTIEVRVITMKLSELQLHAFASGLSFFNFLICCGLIILPECNERNNEIITSTITDHFRLLRLFEKVLF
jgi:predicted transcriptional regulator